MGQLGLTPEHFEEVRHCPSAEAAERVLSEMKALAKRNYRKASKLLHPDLTGNDPEKAALFRLLSEVVQEVEKLKITVPQPPPRIRWVVRFR